MPLDKNSLVLIAKKGGHVGKTYKTLLLSYMGEQVPFS